VTLLWTGVCRIYFTAFEDTPFYWSVDNGDRATEVKCPRVVMAGSFETVVVPEQKVQPAFLQEGECLQAERRNCCCNRLDTSGLA